MCVGGGGLACKVLPLRNGGWAENANVSNARVYPVLIGEGGCIEFGTPDFSIL